MQLHTLIPLQSEKKERERECVWAREEEKDKVIEKERDKQGTEGSHRSLAKITDWLHIRM